MNTPTISVYGIPNCDTVKCARAWLAANHANVYFHDFKKLGVPLPSLKLWVQAVGYQTLLNTRGTLWRRLDDAARASVTDAASAMALMQAQPSVIKRPVVVWPNGAVTVGFDAVNWAQRIH